MPVGAEDGTTATVRATTATDAAASAGIGTRGNDQPRRIGRSTSWYDATATTSVIASRSANSGARSRPVRSPSTTRKIGQWTR
jgi:hypothetical protein